MIEILMATYDGEKYLAHQINSLINQTYSDWSLTIRDDGSRDHTLEIIKHFISLYPNKIRQLTDDKPRQGPTLSFAVLLENSKSDYIMFCDQDDIWLPEKIHKTLKCLNELESSFGHQTPLMVFTDLKMVDRDLNIISDSFIKNQKLFPDIISQTNKLVALNVVTGCTIMINKEAKQYILPIPSKYIIHDHWIAIQISKNGFSKFLPQSTILYRQHSSNVIGSHEINLNYFLRKLLFIKKTMKTYSAITKYAKINMLIFAYYKIVLTVKRLLIK